MAAILEGAGLPHVVNRAGSLLSLFFADGPVADQAGARAADHAAYARLFHLMLERGVYLPPSGYEAWFLSAAHGPDEVDRVLEALQDAVADRATLEA
jgi:glutamate-1-semialdehyde 2,1-aminomutase